MAKIVVHVDHPINDGEKITFKAPCNSANHTGITIYYPASTDGTEASAAFTIKDAAGNSLSSTAGLFATGAYVTVALDTANKIAYIHNAAVAGGDVPAASETTAGVLKLFNTQHDSATDGAYSAAYMKTAYDGVMSAIPSAGTGNPKMDGTAAAGSATTWSKSDHVHPTDTSRQAKITASGILKGNGSGGVSAATAGTDYALPGSIPKAEGTTTPKMNGTASTGGATTWSRSDHVHPTDTSRAPLASPTFTGTPAAPTATAGTNTTQIATTAFVQTAITNAIGTAIAASY